MSTQFLRTEDGEHKFDFACVGCGAYGDLGVPTDRKMQPFGCPEGCGATYVCWKPDGKTPVLKCVVQPVNWLDERYNCPIREFTADGVPVGRCWTYLGTGMICSRHGDVSEAVANYRATGELTDDPRAERKGGGG